MYFHRKMKLSYFQVQQKMLEITLFSSEVFFVCVVKYIVCYVGACTSLKQAAVHSSGIRTLCLMIL